MLQLGGRPCQPGPDEFPALLVAAEASEDRDVVAVGVQRLVGVGSSLCELGFGVRQFGVALGDRGVSIHGGTSLMSYTLMYGTVKRDVRHVNGRTGLSRPRR